MPTSTDLVTDLPADFEVFGQAVDTSLADLKGGTTGQVLKKNSNTDMDFVWGADSAGMTNPMTTTGDTIYSSSGSTPARLGIGSTGQVLTVAGGVPSWGTVATTKSYSLLNTGGTAMSGSQTVTVSGISGVDQLLILVTGMSPASAGGDVYLYINGETTGTKCVYGGLSLNFPTAYSAANGGSATSTGREYYPLGSFSTSAGSVGSAGITMIGTNTSGIKSLIATAGFSKSTGDQQVANNIQGVWTGTATVSSIALYTNSGNFDAGTIYVYGAA